MELIIIDIRSYKSFTNYKTLKERMVLWISTKDFINHKNLINFTFFDEVEAEFCGGTINPNYGHVKLKEPFEDFYNIEKRKSKNGEFNLLLPKNLKPNIPSPGNSDQGKNLIKPEEIVSKSDNLEIEEDKNTLINNLLNYSVKKNIDSKTRDRLFNLIGKEVEKSNFLANSNILKRVEKIEEVVRKDGGSVERPPSEEEDLSISNLPKSYFNQISTYKFLRDYNQDSILSTTCHLCDSNTLLELKEKFGFEQYDCKQHHELIIKRFEELIKKHTNKKGFPKVDYKLIALIRGYLTGKTKNKSKIESGWAGHIKVNWGMDSLLRWAENNPCVPPNPDKDIQDEFETRGFTDFEEFEPNLKLVKLEGVPLNRIQTFNQLVYHFKYLFHIRADNDLKTIIDNNIDFNWREKFEIDFNQIRTDIEFFLDVDKLLQLIEGIMKLIETLRKEHSLEKPKIKMSFYSEDQYVCFSIHHQNTEFKKHIADIDRIGKAFKGLINYQINGLGEFEVRAKLLDNKCYKITYWDFKVCQEKKPHYKKIEMVEGVNYIIRMKKG